ncbi:hypothetical protein ACM66B_003198 [Microbotryomycetes sp. NB124-2]
MFAPPLASRSSATNDVKPAPTTRHADAHNGQKRRKSYADGDSSVAQNGSGSQEGASRPGASRLRAVSFSNLRAKARRSVSPSNRSNQCTTAAGVTTTTLSALMATDSISSRLPPLPAPSTVATSDHGDVGPSFQPAHTDSYDSRTARKVSEASMTSSLDAPRRRSKRVEDRSPVPSFNGSTFSADSSSRTPSSAFRTSVHSADWTPLSEAGPFAGGDLVKEPSEEQLASVRVDSQQAQTFSGLGIQGLKPEPLHRPGSSRPSTGNSSTGNSSTLSPPSDLPGAFPHDKDRLSLPRSPNAFYDATSRSPSNLDESEYLSMDDDTGVEDLASSDDEDYARSFRHLNVRDSVLPQLFRNDDSTQDVVELLNSDRPGIVDLSGKALSDESVPEDATHLLLANCIDPPRLPAFLDRVLPSIASSLVVLDMSYCQLTMLAPVLQTCSALQELDIRGNPLRHLPDWIGQCSELRMLVADEVGLCALPDSLLGLSKLHTLSVRRNCLQCLPSWLHRLRLETLAVDGNPWHPRWAKIVTPVLRSRVPAIDREGRRLSGADQSLLPSALVMEPETSLGSIQLDSVASSPRVSLNASDVVTSSPAYSAQPIVESPTDLENRLNALVSPPLTPPTPETGTVGRKTLKGLFKRMRSGSSAASRPAPQSRTQSNQSLQRLVREEASRSKRASFLSLDPVLPISAKQAVKQTTPQEVQIGLRSFLAYLRDLDTLAEGDQRGLRTSASSSEVGSSSDPALRRTQSSRKMAQTTVTTPSRVAVLRQDSQEGQAQTNPLAKLRDDAVKRERVVREIVETERSYLRGLEELCAVYLASADQPVYSSSGRTKGPVLPVAERKAVFGNIEAIKNLSRDVILPELVKATADSDLPSVNDSTALACRVAEVFKRHAKTFNLYSAYVNNFDAALVRIQSWLQESSRSPLSSAASSPAIGGPLAPVGVAGVASLSANKRKRIRLWLKRCKNDPSHSQISLESYLLLPVQRIPRYRMLLENLAACTPSPRASLSLLAADPSVDLSTLEPHPVVQDALELIGNVATSMNERKRETEGRTALLYWQNRLSTTFPSPLVQPHRVLVRSGSMFLRRTVKRTIAPAEGGGGGPVPVLADEGSDLHVVALLCNDLLALLTESNPDDVNGTVSLLTVCRLDHAFSFSTSPASSFGSPPLLRLVLDSRAILYLSCSNVAAWAQAINTQHAINHPRS